MKSTLTTVMAAVFVITSSVFANALMHRKKLTKAEVSAIFIGKLWRGPSGTFHFKKDGTYTFRNGGKVGGPWNYQLKPDGTIRSTYTNYWFYRKSNGDYQYWHSRSRRFYPAFVN